MIPRHLRISLLVLFAWGLLVVFFLPGLSGSLARIARLGAPGVEQQAHREVTRPETAGTSAPTVKAKLYWAAADGESVEPVEVDLALGTTPEERTRQLMDALIARAPSDARRTVPADAALLEVYVLQGGAALLDFSAALGASLPSGIRSERLAVDSIVQTLAANVPQIQSVKILIQGQEADTLAGHVDLTGYFAIARPAASEKAGTRASQ